MPDSELENHRFAQMNGAKIDEAPHQVEKQTEDAEPEEIITTRQTWQQPWLKALVVSSGVFVVVAFLGGMALNTINAVNTSTAKKQKIAASSPNSTIESIDGDDKGQDKTDVALTSQKNELRELNSRSTPERPLAEPKPAPTAQLRSRIATTPIPRVRPIPTTEAVSTPTLHRFSVVASERRHPQETVTKAEYHPTSAAGNALPVAPSLKPTPVDPMQQWLMASYVGSYGNSFASSSPPAQTKDLKGVQGEESMTGVSTLRNNNANNTSIDVQSQNINRGKRILVGSRTEGKLETPIAWGGTSRTETNQNYLIALSKPLKADDSSIVIPAGSYMVARVSNSHDGYLQLVAVSAIINDRGNTEEKSIPENAILVLGKNGKLLKAESHKQSALASSLASSVLSGVAKAAEVQNRPTSQTSLNSIGVSTITINDKKDLAAGFTQGSFDEIVSRMRASNQNQLQKIQSSQKVFVVESGTKLQIFVNRTFSL